MYILYLTFYTYFTFCTCTALCIYLTFYTYFSISTFSDILHLFYLLHILWHSTLILHSPQPLHDKNFEFYWIFSYTRHGLKQWYINNFLNYRNSPNKGQRFDLSYIPTFILANLHFRWCPKVLNLNLKIKLFSMNNFLKVFRYCILHLKAAHATV